MTADFLSIYSTFPFGNEIITWIIKKVDFAQLEQAAKISESDWYKTYAKKTRRLSALLQLTIATIQLIRLLY